MYSFSGLESGSSGSWRLSRMHWQISDRDSGRTPRDPSAGGKHSSSVIACLSGSQRSVAMMQFGLPFSASTHGSIGFEYLKVVFGGVNSVWQVVPLLLQPFSSLL